MTDRAPTFFPRSPGVRARGVVRRMLLVLAIVLAPAAAALPPGLPSTAAAQDLPAIGERQAIVAVIQAQLDAFQRDAWSEAWSYASPGIQAMFRTPERFRSMVTGGYRPVYRPQAVEFLDIIVERGKPTQRVALIGPDGVGVVAHYAMELQPDGSWKIAGVTLFETDDRAA